MGKNKHTTMRVKRERADQIRRIADSQKPTKSVQEWTDKLLRYGITALGLGRAAGRGEEETGDVGD